MAWPWSPQLVRGERRLAVAAVAAGLVVAVVVGAACGESDPRPRDVSLEQLVTQDATYHGDLVRAEGVMASFAEGSTLHYWIEDDSSNRVGVVPNHEAAPFLGSAVVVVGTFRFDEHRGRTITVDRIERVGEG